jgi:hypothetical protein
MSGVVSNVMTYPSGQLYSRLANQPTSHPSRNPSYFVVDPTTDPNALARMASRLLLAYALQESVNIGYDSQGGCLDGYIHAWRIG